jgi:acetyl-CoA C-acetyltransferase
MGSRVGIIGYALDKYGGDIVTSIEEAGFNVAKRAQLNSGIERDEIGSVHNSTMDMFDGITISNGILIAAAGGYNRDATRVQNGGLFAIISACAKILAGGSSVAVVSSTDSVKYDLLKVSTMSTDPFFQQPLNYNYMTSYSLFSSQYLNQNGISDESYALVAAQNYRAGASNPDAHIRSGYSLENVLSSPMVSWPLRTLEVVSDPAFGGAAVILASEEKAKAISASPLWITGFGMGSNSVNIDESIKMMALRKAARDAYRMAGVKDARREIDVAEINSPFSAWELAAYEALNFCQGGKEEELLKKGVTSLEGDLPVNPSGGTLCTNAPNSGGLFRFVQAAIYLHTDQKRNARRALVHDSDMSIGLCGDSHALVILEKEV